MCHVFNTDHPCDSVLNFFDLSFRRRFVVLQLLSNVAIVFCPRSTHCSSLSTIWTGNCSCAVFWAIPLPMFPAPVATVRLASCPVGLHSLHEFSGMAESSQTSLSIAECDRRLPMVSEQDFISAFQTYHDTLQDPSAQIDSIRPLVNDHATTHFEIAGQSFKMRRDNEP